MWEIISQILLMLLRRAWAAFFGKRNKALLPVEADRTIIKTEDVTFDLPRLKSFGLDEERRVISFSDGRSVVEVLIDDITELSLTFQPKTQEAVDGKT